MEIHLFLFGFNAFKSKFFKKIIKTEKSREFSKKSCFLFLKIWTVPFLWSLYKIFAKNSVDILNQEPFWAHIQEAASLLLHNEVLSSLSSLWAQAQAYFKTHTIVNFRFIATYYIFLRKSLHTFYFSKIFVFVHPGLLIWRVSKIFF